MGEEGSNHRGSSGLEWHIDPIDGTVNFVYDLPGWCTSVAVLRNGPPIAGAVYAPVVDELYSAALGNGTTINGDAVERVGSHRPLNVTGCDRIQLPPRRPPPRPGRSDRSGAADRARHPPTGKCGARSRVRRCGRVDLYFEEFINSWDIAAGILLVPEAGGRVTSFDGSEIDVTFPYGVVASTPSLHAAVVDSVLD